MKPPKTLEDYDVYIQREKSLSPDCPELLQELFTLILSVPSLKWEYFGGTSAQDQSLQPTPLMQYQSELKLEAEQLADTCDHYKRADDPEPAWMEVLKPIVFYRFNVEAEGCFSCCKHFPLRSRPQVGWQTRRQNEVLYDVRLRGVHSNEEDSKNADVCKVHLNYPNFDMGLMTYSGYKDEKRKIPDLTVGLLVSSKRYWHAPPGMTTTEFAKIMDHQLVKPFFHDVFDKLEKDGSIKPLFAFSGPRKGNHTSRTSKSSINFPFMIWEAKKAGEGEPVGQNALKVRMVLGWQRNLAKRTNTAWTPLVYHIVSVGSELKLYACYVPRSSAGEKDTYVFQMLWSGDCVNPAEALQLLYLIDIIALWGQFQYKPFAAACIQILKTKQEGNRGLRLSDAKPLQFSKAINAWEFPSLQFDGLPLIASPGSPFGLRRAGTKTSVSELADQLRRGMRLHDPRNYFIPERDAYIWLLHRELRGADLLVVRVNIEGCVLPPLVIFESAYGSSPDFRYIIEQERLRMPKNVEVEFRYDKNRTSFLQKCFSIDKGQCTKSEIQFCAILPLRKRGTGQGDADTRTEFHPLEQLLGLQTLINAAQSTNKLWCTCQGLETEDMVLCDSTNCAYLWYHMDCENVSEVNSAQPWFCRACKQGGNIKLSSYDDDKNFEDGIVKASDKRIQRVRSLSRAWSNHEWPDPSKVRKLMYKKICCEIEMETRERKFQDTVEVLEAERASSAIQSRAIIRADPLRMTKIKQRFRAKSVPR